jgi:DNA replication protein DnaC
METEDLMQQLATTLTVIRGKLQPDERAAATRSTGRGNEPRCRICDDTGWRRADGEEFIGLKRCECLDARVRAARLAVIPERFKASTFESYRPRNPKQQRALDLMQRDPSGSWYLTGSYGSGKTHLLYAQYDEMVMVSKTQCHVRTTRDLLEELRRAEFDNEFVSPVLAAASQSSPYHFFWDDVDKMKTTDFKTEVLFDLVDSLYRQKHGLTVTSNYSMQDLINRERLHPAIVRRMDDMCRVVEL